MREKRVIEEASDSFRRRSVWDKRRLSGEAFRRGFTGTSSYSPSGQDRGQGHTALSDPAAEYLRGFQFPRLNRGQSGEDWGRSGRGVKLLVLERHVKAGRGGGGCAL